MQIVAGQQQRTVRKADSARVVANSLTAQAEEALKRRQAAADELAEAKQEAAQRSRVARDALAADTAQKNQLLAELAQTRRTSIEVERQREEGLRRQAEQQREATAREAVDNDRPAGHNGSGTGSGSGAEASSGSSSSGSSGSSNSSGSSSGSSSAGASAVAWAKGRLGLPYQWGGEGPGSYDCSGLTMKAWAQAGVALPHSSRLQYQSVEHVSYGNLRPGDLLFFGTSVSNPESIHHVAMYVGNGQMIEAPYTGAQIRIVPLRSSGAMPYAGRV
nr:C40 family peptidase [Kineosporia babensis]